MTVCVAAMVDGVIFSNASPQRLSDNGDTHVGSAFVAFGCKCMQIATWRNDSGGLSNVCSGERAGVSRPGAWR